MHFLLCVCVLQHTPARLRKLPARTPPLHALPTSHSLTRSFAHSLTHILPLVWGRCAWVRACAHAYVHMHMRVCACVQTSNYRGRHGGCGCHAHLQGLQGLKGSHDLKPKHGAHWGYIWPTPADVGD